uniref:Uncharacterized protein n=1 Tax=Eutreptiella gymnastica TaxID=73025 RepID=A0A7S4CR15_9EUGL
MKIQIRQPNCILQLLGVHMLQQEDVVKILCRSVTIELGVPKFSKDAHLMQCPPLPVHLCNLNRLTLFSSTYLLSSFFPLTCKDSVADMGERMVTNSAACSPR